MTVFHVIKQLSQPFVICAYRNTYRSRLCNAVFIRVRNSGLGSRLERLRVSRAAASGRVWSRARDHATFQNDFRDISYGIKDTSDKR